MAVLSGEEEKADRFLIRALQRDPRWKTTQHLLSNLASKRIKGRRWGAAHRLLQGAVRVAPELEEAWLLLGNLAVRRGQQRKGERFYRRALKLRPGFHAARRNLIWVLRREGKVAEAVRLALGASKGKARNLLLLRLGEDLASSRNYFLLWAVARVLCQERAVPRRAYEMAGFALLHLGRAQKAVHHLKEALQRQPRRVYLYRWLVRAKLVLGDRSGALEALQQGLSLHPGHPFLLRLTRQVRQIALPPVSRPASRTTGQGREAKEGRPEKKRMRH